MKSDGCEELGATMGAKVVQRVREKYGVMVTDWVGEVFQKAINDECEEMVAELTASRLEIKRLRKGLWK